MESLDLKKKKITTNNIKKILPYYKKSKKKFILIIIFLLLSGFCQIFGPIFSANALANLAELNFDKTIKFGSLMLLMMILGNLLNMIVEKLHVRVNTSTRFELTKKVINSINNTKMSKLDESKLGALSERLSNDISSVSDTYLSMISIYFNIITDFVFLCYIAFLNIYLFLILLVYVVILFFVCTIRSRIWIRGRKLTAKAKDEAKSAYFEQINGIRDVKLLNIKDNITEYSNEKFKKSLSLEISIRDKRDYLRRVQNILSASFELLFIILGVIFIKKEFIILSGFLIIFSYYGKVERLIGYLSNYKEFKADGEVSATRIFEIIEGFEKEKFGDTEISNFSGKIEIKNVEFSYDGNNSVLKNLNMTFEPNKMTAIVGRSGSGKTTILNLISKLYDIKDGAVLFDGIDINELTENSIRENICEISQSPYIFNTSIRQNLLFAKPTATEDEMIEVLKHAQVYEDISKMENGIDTEIGENGVKISGGQRQRLAIARLLLKNNKVIVFDESTSALDNRSQKKIVELLETLKENRTIIIVAHRLSTIIGADKIYMIDEGKVLASGTHRELMNNCEKYSELYLLEENEAKIIN